MPIGLFFNRPSQPCPFAITVKVTNFVIIAGSNVATITIVTTDIADSVELLVRRKSVQIAAD